MRPLCEKNIRMLALFCCILAAGAAFCPERAAAEEGLGRRVRVAYIEGGFYTDYFKVLVALAHGLEELGIIANGAVTVPESVENTADVWQWLHANAGGANIEFMADGYYSAGWDDAVFAEKRAALITRLNETKDIDLVFAFGTKAGQAMATDDHKTPVAVLSVTDAVAANIIPSHEDSGRDHVFAIVEQDRYYREVVLFNDIFRFKRLGVVYEDSAKGRASVALPQLQKAADDSNIELVTCVGRFFSDDAVQTVADLIACHEQLVKGGADAVYMTVNNGMRAEMMDDILRPLMTERLPTFSQNGADDVKFGVLLSISLVNFSGQGMFAAKAIAKIIRGESPRSLEQSYEEPLSLAVNLRTAMLIGWNPSLAVLAAVDQIFQGQKLGQP